MLQQILKQMYIEPELLSELSEEQKQILFIKLREEQIRRWTEEDEKHEKAQAKNNIKPKKPPKPGKQPKTVKFLTSKDGNEWVWVMGEHKDDLTVEQILEREAQSKAATLASEEAEKLRRKEEAEMKEQMEQETKELKRRKLAREAEIRRKKEAAELYQSLKEARLEAERLEKEKREHEEEEKKKLQLLTLRQERSRKLSVDNANILKKRRSTEIYKSLQEKRERDEKIAIENSKELDESYQEQEKKAKEAEYKRKEIARHAREEIKGTLTRGSKVIQATNAFKSSGRLPPGKKPPIPPKKNLSRDQYSIKKSKYRTSPLPPNRQAVIDWFIHEEKPRGAGIDLQTNEIAEWFHGIISRSEAENILEGSKKGSYIVRVSERVWGYTISYKADDRLKHFLIDTSDEGYQFFGAHQVRHETLSDLVNFHKDTPITIVGDEILVYPVGQITAVPNYSELFPNNSVMTSL